MIKVGAIGCEKYSHLREWLPFINGRKSRFNMRITHIWDKNKSNCRDLCKRYKCKEMLNLKDFLGEIDGVIITSIDTRDYYNYAKMFFKAHIPVFINRPLAPDIQTAEKILELAKKEKTPVMSASSLYFAKPVIKAREQIKALGGIRTFSCIVSGTIFEWYMPHAISMFYSILGGDIEYIHSFNPENESNRKISEIICYIQYSSKKGNNYGGTAKFISDLKYKLYHLELFGNKRSLKIDGISDKDCVYFPLLFEIEKMFRLGKEPIKHADLLNMVKIYYAIRKSYFNNKRIYLK